MIAVELINRALNLSGIIARTLDSEDDEEGVDGLFWLNQLLAEKSATGMLLPYFAHIEVVSIAGQEKYFVQDLITAEVLTFELQGVRYNVPGQTRNKYWGCARANNIESLPFQWYWERVNGGMDIYVYFKPSQQIELFTISGLTSLGQVSFDSDLSQFMDGFYQNFLLFELAESLCIFYKISLPPQTADKLKRLRKQMVTINPRDFTIKKKSMLGDGGILSYAQMSIGRGWTAAK